MRAIIPVLVAAASFVSGCASTPQGRLLAPRTKKAATVVVSCMIETSGLPDHCQVLSSTGGAAYAASTLAWLNGPNPPRYKPSMQHGIAVAEEHRWQITYKPSSN